MARGSPSGEDQARGLSHSESPSPCTVLGPTGPLGPHHPAHPRDMPGFWSVQYCYPSLVAVVFTSLDRDPGMGAFPTFRTPWAELC